MLAFKALFAALVLTVQLAHAKNHHGCNVGDCGVTEHAASKHEKKMLRAWTKGNDGVFRLDVEGVGGCYLDKRGFVYNKCGAAYLITTFKDFQTKNAYYSVKIDGLVEDGCCIPDDWWDEFTGIAYIKDIPW
ncbi:hypothetical protein Moror_5919 [Moniliophthora roreri MCA 2997]|uniref:Uncharacterized protein n=1 Tax=Moniliophthora roreri (strain MCA 2997) TaxID=1381753 RepID=V2WYX4_MONRO|nr:hypothetical protein Moror_5919 [Moniliophthora roreri MCA 2997]